MKTGVRRRPGSWLWFQMPVEAGDIVPLMYRQGLSMQACISRLAHRYPASAVRTAWKSAHQSGQALNRTRTLPVVPPAPRPTFPLYVVKDTIMHASGSKNEPRPASRRGEKRPENDASFVYRQREHLANARAGILHLVDLKRAGHSARFTEYKIPSDHGSSARISRPLAQISFTGSSSATAAGL